MNEEQRQHHNQRVAEAAVNAALMAVWCRFVDVCSDRLLESPAHWAWSAGTCVHCDRSRWRLYFGRNAFTRFDYDVTFGIHGGQKRYYRACANDNWTAADLAEQVAYRRALDERHAPHDRAADGAHSGPSGLS